MFTLVIKLFFIHFFALASPGPDFFFVVRKAVTENTRSAVLGIIGIIAGLSIWLSASVLGLAILFKFYPPIEMVILLLGGGYLGYLGFLMLNVRRNINIAQMDHIASGRAQQASGWSSLWQGLFVNLSNPKVIIYFSGIFSLLVSSVSNYLYIILISLMILVESFVYFYILSRIFSLKRVRQFYASYSRYIDNVSGVVFVIFGLLLVYRGIELML